MWLAAWLWAKKGVEMGVGWGRTPFSERGNLVEERGIAKCLGILELAARAGEMGAHLGIPSRGAWGSWWVGGWVGVSVRVCVRARGREDRRAGGRKGAGWGVCGEGPGPRGAPGSERQWQGA